MAKITKINHVAIALPDIGKGLEFWRDMLGLHFDHTEEVPSQNVEVAFLHVGEAHIELVKPTSEESATGKFLNDKGPGIHHLCMEVDDIDGMLVQLKEKNVRLIDETARELPGRKMAFVHPKSTGGILLELYEVTRK